MGLARRLGTTALLMTCAAVVVRVAMAQESEMVDGSEREWQPNVETYAVQRGDNLWDVTGRVVGKPWLWPRVWAMNPEISNPNWVYPGDIVRFFPSDQPLPSLGGGQAIAANSDVVEIAGDAPAAGAEENHQLVEVIDNREAASGGLVERPPREWIELVGSFITSAELAQAGVLTHSPKERMLLSRSDEVYLTFGGSKQPMKGDKYLVYRTVRKVRHPKTQALWGYMTQVTGIARVHEVDAAVSRATLTNAFVEIERGQYVSPFDTDILAKVVEVPAGEPVSGYVLALGNGLDVMAGSNDVVFVDLGRKDGLVRGNRLSVLRSGDPLTGKTAGLPEIPVATLLVIDSRETASTCLVADASLEVQPGDRVRAITAKQR